MGEDGYLPSMVGFVSNHIAEHLRADRPGLSPAVSQETRDAAPATERLGQHFRASRAALGQPKPGLFGCAVGAVQLCWNAEVRGCKPDPLAADIMHMREDRRDCADVAVRLGIPDGGIKLFDEILVDSLVGGKDPHCGLAGLSGCFEWAC